MQLVGTLFAGIGKAAAGATAAGGAAASGGSVLSGLSAASGVLGAIGTIGSAVAARNQAKAQAAELEHQSREEYIQSQSTSAALKNELARTLANQTVGFAAAGVDLGSVSVQEAKTQAVRDAERELGISSNEAVSRSLARRRQARSVRDRGRNAVFSGLVKGAGQLVNTGLDFNSRRDQARIS